MSSEERKNIHEQLDELINDDFESRGQDSYRQGKNQYNTNESELNEQKAHKKNKKKRNKKKKKEQELIAQLKENKDNIQLPSTPLQYKLGASLQATCQCPVTFQYSYEDSDSSEDEGLPDYKIGGYHPMHVGEILIDRYLIIQKLGWGHFSTVWLAKDLNYNTFVALKIQRSAPHYLEAAFDEVEILDQVSSYWMKPQWLESLKKYYKDQPDKLNKITGEDSYCVQLLNCFLHNGPHGRHFVMVFEILGVNFLEIIKRYNYKGVPMPLVRIMSKQCLMGLDYLHRICKIIHTDLKPENVSLCLTEKEVNEIASNGCLTTTKMYNQENIKKMFNANTLDPKSYRGRKEFKDDQKLKEGKQSKRTQKKKRQKQRKKQRKMQEQENEGALQTEEDQTLERENETISPDNLSKKIQQNNKKNVHLINKNDSRKQSPHQIQKNIQQNQQQSKEFSLKNLTPSQMKELNQMLEQFIEVPKGFSLPRLKYNGHLHGVDLETEEELQMLMHEMDQDSKYEYDITDYEKFRNQLEEFLFFRKKFEQSQKAMAKKEDDQSTTVNTTNSGLNKLGIPNLNLQNLDPRKMQQEIEEERSKKRGPKLDENLRVKICDLGNGCWTYHHFSTEIQTRQYISPEVIIGAKYGTSADIWSFACMMFEMATGDFLFEPRKGKTFDKDDDHLAQMMELLGRMPSTLALSGKHSKKFFDRNGNFKRIRGLNYWPLSKVLIEKYKFKEKEAYAFADFLIPMLEWDPEKRANAQTMLDHYWLKMPNNYDTKMSDEELQMYLDRQSLMRDVIDDGMANQEMSKVGESQTEQNIADIEDNDESFFSDLSQDDDPYFTLSEDEELNPKEHRDIAEGKNMNNSFTGPYPENWDHLHIDKGVNPQFLAFNEINNTAIKKVVEKHAQLIK